MFGIGVWELLVVAILVALVVLVVWAIARRGTP